MKHTAFGQHLLCWVSCCCAGCFHPDPGKQINASMLPNTGFMLRSVEIQTAAHKYSIFVPRDYSPARRYPAIVFLHGIGEAGSDGKKCTTVGIGPAIARRGGDFPFIVLFPQTGWDWTSQEAAQLVIAVLQDARDDYSIDADRVTLTGLSSGGKGTWVLGARYPQMWNALVPMGGYADYESIPTLLSTRMPIWALHNRGDFFVNVSGTRAMVQRIRASGGNIRYTEYDQGGHNCWDRAYDEGELFVWLQQQRVSAR
jgi:predicted peptidase